jgi:nitrile hydratase
MTGPGQRGHDVGGQPAGECTRDEHESAAWELRADALGEVIWGKAALLKVDELRRLREDLGPTAYDHMSYYERWMHSLAQGLIEHGTITVEELANAMAVPAVARAATDGAPGPSAALFTAGDKVRVRDMDPPGHIRTPWYCRGREGEIVQFCGLFRNPEELAYAIPSDRVSRQPLYSVRFAASRLWPGFAENSRDMVDIEIYQHWLEPAT